MVVIALTNNDKDVVTLLDAMKRMSVNPKYLFIETQLLNYNLLHNKTINYKVLINHLQQNPCSGERARTVHTTSHHRSLRREYCTLDSNSL